MDVHAEKMLRCAKRQLNRGGKFPPDPLIAYRILGAIVEMFPQTTAAKEASMLLRSADFPSSGSDSSSFAGLDRLR